jgi:hypothetical protein
MTPELRAACEQVGPHETSIVARALLDTSAATDGDPETEMGTRLMSHFGTELSDWASGGSVAPGLDPALCDIVDGRTDAAEDWATYLRRAEPLGPLDSALADEVDRALLAAMDALD